MNRRLELFSIVLFALNAGVVGGGVSSALADEAGFTVRSPRDPNQRGGVVVIDVENGYEVVKELAKRDILMDYRPGAGIRIAPHFYTKDEELDETIQAIRAMSLQTA